MLPITTRRIIHVPHSLAIAAAAVAVATALSWSSLSRPASDRIQNHDDTVVSTQPESRSDPHRRLPVASKGKKPDGGNGSVNRFPELLPPFLPRLPEI